VLALHFEGMGCGEGDTPSPPPDMSKKINVEMWMWFEAFKLEMAVSYPVRGECQFHAKSHKLIGTFWLVLLTEHEVFHLFNVVIATRRMRSATAWFPDPSCGFSSMLPSFQSLSGNSLNSLRAPYPFDR